MKAGYFFILLFSVSLKINAQHKNVTALFIGNSYTYVNVLPQMIANIALAGGDTLNWDLSAPGGYTFQMHTTDATTLAKIQQQSWDYVVLQEQSQIPSWEPSMVDSLSIPFALMLDSLINAANPCTQTVFFETWGRRYGDAANCQFYPPVCTYDGMQQRLMESYKLMADTCEELMSPVGEAFRAAMNQDSTLNLYQSDNSHPSLQGTYLAACVFYSILFHKSPEGNSFDPGVTQLPISSFQTIAWNVVQDSLNFWNAGIYEPWAEFSYNEVSACEVEFSGKSDSGFNHFWDFGDTDFSTLANPVHHYSGPGYMTITHIVYDSCKSDTFQLVADVICASAVQELSDEEFSIYPNPVTEKMSFKFPERRRGTVTIYNYVGEKIREFNPGRSPSTISISFLPQGIYFLVYSVDSQQHFIKKFAVGGK